MPNTVKNRVLYILKYLQEQTDEEHPKTTTEIIEYLSANGIEAGRKTVADDITQLQECGYDVICIKSRQNKYFIGERILELSELKLLVDAVQAAVFVPPSKSKRLITKLSALASPYQAQELNRKLYVNGRVKLGGDSVLYSIDTIYTTINAGKRITFKSFDYSAKKRKTYKHDGKRYEFSPYDLVWSNDRYYVFGYSEAHQSLVKFRVDRISQPEILDVSVREKPKGYNIASICKQTFLMYDAEVVKVELLCDNDMMNAIVDHFGVDVETSEVDERHFKVTANIAISATFFAWIFTYCGRIRIISPAEAVDGYREHLEKAYRNA